MRRKLQSQKGITLVALVVTIIVLIILAGVSISLVLGDNGIVTKAKLGKQNMEKAQEEEKDSLLEFANEMDYHIASSSREYFTETELWEGDTSLAGTTEIQLNDSYENYKSLVFILGNGTTNAGYADREVLVSTIKYSKKFSNNVYAMHWFENSYVVLTFPEDTTKINWTSASGTIIYRIIGLK